MFTYQFTANSQDNSGDLQSTVVYTNGTITITESQTNANAASQKATINSRLTQLQAAEDFVTANPAGGEPSSTPLT